MKAKLECINKAIDNENVEIAKSTGFLLRKTGSLQFGETCFECGHHF